MTKQSIHEPMTMVTSESASLGSGIIPFTPNRSRLPSTTKSHVAASVSVALLLVACGSPIEEEDVRSAASGTIVCDKAPGPRGLRYSVPLTVTPASAAALQLSSSDTRVISVTRVATPSSSRQTVHAVRGKSVWSLKTTDDSALASGSTYSILYEQLPTAAGSISQALRAPVEGRIAPLEPEPFWKQEPESSDIPVEKQPSQFLHTATKSNLVDNETCFDDIKAPIDPSAFLVVYPYSGQAAVARHVPDRKLVWCISLEDPSAVIQLGDTFGIDVYVPSASEACEPTVPSETQP